jgi:uncharacterized protein YheU (UPF0270 family)
VAIEVPWQQLSEETFNALMESFIGREGTDYGEFEMTMEQKQQQLMSQIKAGQAVIVFDEDSQTCNLLTKQEWNELQRRSSEDEYFGY